MRSLIDADGRLFGRLHLFDALVVAFLVLIGGLVVSATGIFTQAVPREVRPSSPPAQINELIPNSGVAPNLQGNLVPATLEANALLFDLTPEEASQLAVGDAQRDADGRVSRELVNIYRIDARRRAADVELGHPVWVVDPHERQANVRIRFYGYRAEGMFFIEGGQRLRAASQLPFQTAKYSATFQLEELDRLASRELPPVEVEVPAVLIELTPEEAKRVAPGDRHVNVMGEVVAEIVSMGAPVVRQAHLHLSQTVRMKIADPQEREVPVVMRIYGYRSGPMLMTREDERIIVGEQSQYRFITDRYTAAFFVVDQSKSEAARD